MRSRRNNRGNQTLTVIDPNTRLKNGLPILNVAAEMDHYKILDPYGKDNQYYDDHYVCLWQVTENEIVGHWKWDDLVAKENWYQTIIMPAFLRFRTQTMPMVPRDEISDLTAGLNQLSCRAMIWSSNYDSADRVKVQAIPPPTQSMPCTEIRTHQARRDSSMPLRAIPARILTTKLRKPTELMISSRSLRVIGER